VGLVSANFALPLGRLGPPRVCRVQGRGLRAMAGPLARRARLWGQGWRGPITGDKLVGAYFAAGRRDFKPSAIGLCDPQRMAF
jgi:hypothetical protein